MDQEYITHLKNTYLPDEFSVLEHEKFNPEVWGPHYWFFLHTVAHTYPLMPNSVTKRKYYDLIQNLPLFIPNSKIGDEFSKLLDRFPVSPYLDNRDSFIRWVHFIHNKINKMLDKEELTLFEELDDYFSNYKPKQVKMSEKMNIKKEYIIGAFTILCIILIVYFYNFL